MHFKMEFEYSSYQEHKLWNYLQIFDNYQLSSSSLTKTADSCKKIGGNSIIYALDKKNIQTPCITTEQMNLFTLNSVVWSPWPSG